MEQLQCHAFYVIQEKNSGALLRAEAGGFGHDGYVIGGFGKPFVAVFSNKHKKNMAAHKKILQIDSLAIANEILLTINDTLKYGVISTGMFPEVSDPREKKTTELIKKGIKIDLKQLVGSNIPYEFVIRKLVTELYLEDM